MVLQLKLKTLKLVIGFLSTFDFSAIVIHGNWQNSLTYKNLKYLLQNSIFRVYLYFYRQATCNTVDKKGCYCGLLFWPSGPFGTNHNGLYAEHTPCENYVDDNSQVTLIQLSFFFRQVLLYYTTIK